MRHTRAIVVAAALAVACLVWVWLAPAPPLEAPVASRLSGEQAVDRGTAGASRAQETAAAPAGARRVARLAALAEQRSRDGGASVEAARPAASEPAAEAELTSVQRADADAPQPIQLEAPDVPAPGAPGHGTARPSGFDPGAPRPLALWRQRAGRWAVAARGFSRADGSLAFPALPVPAEGLALVVAPAGAAPDAIGASELRRAAPRAPLAPGVELIASVNATSGGARAGAVLRLQPLEAVGEVLVWFGGAAEPERFDVAPQAGAVARGFEIDVAAAELAAAISVAHELPDGRRSAWRALAIPEPANPGAEESKSCEPNGCT